MNLSATGRIYVFEGPDGVGKTTLAKSIVSRLQKLNVPCEYLSFPGNEMNTIGSLVYKLHHDSSSVGVDSINCTSMQALHVASHIDVIERRIKPLLKVGVSVVLDRYWWSTFVYGILAGANRKALNLIINAEKAIWKNILPEYVFYIRRTDSLPAHENINENLIREYEVIASSESKRCNVNVVENNVIESSVGHILSLIVKNNLRYKACAESQCSLIARTRGETNKQISYPPSSLTRLLEPTIVYDTYWHFAAKRQDIFFARINKQNRPWSDDPILEKHKFTNAYRASDRVSQFLIKEVIYGGDFDLEDLFFRIILFKLFNKIDTWRLLEDKIGVISCKSFSMEKFDKVLSEAIDRHVRIYSAAYIMPTGGRGSAHSRKHRLHLELLKHMIEDRLPAKIERASSMGKVFELLRSYHGIGDFLAYQYATDINYSEITNFPETQFVIPGPGARDGIRKCFAKNGGLTDGEIIKVVMQNQEEEFERLGISFKSLWGRTLQLIDCQNLFCETDKYARVKHPEFTGESGRTRIKQKFVPAPTAIEYWYPPKWGINALINSGNCHE